MKPYLSELLIDFAKTFPDFECESRHDEVWAWACNQIKVMEKYGVEINTVSFHHVFTEGPFDMWIATGIIIHERSEPLMEK
mgnify:CR=1 FL=1